MDAGYIEIPGWDRFQHYKDRDPIWIKNYVKLLAKDEYTALTFTQRGILHGIWMEYASSARRLRGDTLTLTRRLGQKVSRRDLESLVHAGFIQISASKTLAHVDKSASTEVEKEIEVEKKKTPPTPPSGTRKRVTNGRVRTDEEHTHFKALFAAVEAEGIKAPSGANGSARSGFTQLVWGLVDEHVTPAAVAAKADAYRRHDTLGQTMLTLPALTKWWGQLEADTETGVDRLRRSMAERGIA